jgi:hypothetical protein
MGCLFMISLLLAVIIPQAHTFFVNEFFDLGCQLTLGTQTQAGSIYDVKQFPGLRADLVSDQWRNRRRHCG